LTGTVSPRTVAALETAMDHPCLRTTAFTDPATLRHLLRVDLNILELDLAIMCDVLAEEGEDGLRRHIQAAIDFSPIPHLHDRLWNWVGTAAIAEAVIAYGRVHTDTVVPDSHGFTAPDEAAAAADKPADLARHLGDGHAEGEEVGHGPDSTAEDAPAQPLG
jgi:hypothetical protein